MTTPINSPHRTDPSSRDDGIGIHGTAASSKISTASKFLYEDSEWLRDDPTGKPNVPLDGGGDHFNHFLEAGKAMVGKRERGSLLFQGTGVDVDEWEREYKNPYLESDLLAQSYATLSENPTVGEEQSKAREVFAQRIEEQQRTLAEKEEFLKRVQASSGKAKQAVLDAEQSASQAFAMFETLRKQGPFMGFEARARARRKYVYEKTYADTLQQEAKKAKREAVNLKEYIVSHGLDASSYESVRDVREEVEAADESSNREGAVQSEETQDKQPLETWEAAYRDGVKLAHAQTVDRREQRLALEKQQQLRRHTALLEKQKTMRNELKEHMKDTDEDDDSIIDEDAKANDRTAEDHTETIPDGVHSQVSFQQLDVGLIKDPFVARGLTKDTAPPLCLAWAHSECVAASGKACKARHFFVSEAEKRGACVEREKQNAKVEMEVLLAINTREALLMEIKQEMAECETKQLSRLSTTFSLSDVGLLIQYLNQLRVATVHVIEAVERWQTHMVKHLLPKVQLNGSSKSTDHGWIVKVASRGERLYDATTAYKSRLKRLSRDARPAQYATDFEVVGIFPTKLEALRAFEHLRSIEAAAKMTTPENLPPFKVVTRSCGIHMCIESDVGLEETRCEICYAKALGHDGKSKSQGADTTSSGAAPKFLWQGGDYLQKVSMDTHFLEDSSVLRRFFASTDFAFHNNPLLLATDLTLVPLEPAPFHKMDGTVNEEQYNAHYAEYVAASFGVPSAKVLIYDNGCSEWFGHVSKTPTVKVGRDLSYVSQLVTSRAAVDAFVKSYKDLSVKILDTTRVVYCLEFLRDGPKAAREHASVAEDWNRSTGGSMHLPNIKEEDIVEHGDDYSWIFELALGHRRQAKMGLSRLEKLRLNRVHTAYYWDSGEYIAIRQHRHEDSGLEPGVFCSVGPGKPWEQDRVRGSQKKRFTFEQKLKKQGEELRMRRSIVQIYIKREMANSYGFRPFVLDYLIYVANQLGGSTLMLDVQQAETFLQSMITRTTSAIIIQRISRGSRARQRFQDLRRSLQQRVRQECVLDRVAASQGKKIVASVFQKAVRRAGKRVKPPQFQTSLRLCKRRVIMAIYSKDPYDRENMALRAEPCLACLKTVSHKRRRRDLTSMQLRGLDSLGNIESVELGNLRLQRVTERTDSGPCYCARMQSSNASQITLNIYDSTDCRTHRIVLSEADIGRSLQSFHVFKRLQLKAALLRCTVSRLVAATAQKKSIVSRAEAEGRSRIEARENCAALLEDDRLMALAAGIHLTTMSQVADGAVAFSNDQLALYEDLEASNQQNAWDPLEEANNAIYLQRKRQAEKLVSMTISMLHTTRHKNFMQQMTCAAFLREVSKLKSSLQAFEQRAARCNAELAATELRLEQATKARDSAIRFIVKRIHLRNIASPSKVHINVGLKKKEHPGGLLYCSVITVKSALIPREPISRLRIRVSIAAAPGRFRESPVKSVFTSIDSNRNNANPFDPTWKWGEYRADFDGGPAAPFLGCVDVVCQVEGKEEETKWLVSEPDLLYLLRDSHHGLPGVSVPELTSSKRVRPTHARGKASTVTFKSRRDDVEEVQSKAIKRVVELLHVDAFTGELKLGKLALLRRIEHLFTCLVRTQWWKDLQKQRTSQKGVQVLSSTYIIHGKMCTVSVFENHGDLTVDCMPLLSAEALTGEGALPVTKSDSFCLMECNIRAALQDRTEVLAWWSQSVRCCRYSPKLILVVLDRVYIDAQGSFSIMPSPSEALRPYASLRCITGRYNYFVVRRTSMSISDFDSILTVLGNAHGDMQLIVERRPLSCGPTLSMKLSRIELRELCAVQDLPDEDVSLRYLKKISSAVIPLLAIRRRMEELPAIRDHPLLKKYCKMLRLGVPPFAVRQKILLDLAGSTAPLNEVCKCVLIANPLDTVPPELRIDPTVREALVLSNRQQEEHWRLLGTGQLSPEASNASPCRYQLLQRFSNLWIKLAHDPSPQVATSKAPVESDSDCEESCTSKNTAPSSKKMNLREDSLRAALCTSLGVTTTGMLSLCDSDICIQKLSLTKADKAVLHTSGEFTHRVNPRATANVEWVSPRCGPEMRVRIYDTVFCNAQFYRVWLKSEKSLIAEIDSRISMLASWVKDLSWCYCSTGQKQRGYTTWRRHVMKWNGELCLIRVLVHDIRKDICVVVLPIGRELTCASIYCSDECPQCCAPTADSDGLCTSELNEQEEDEARSQAETSQSSIQSPIPDEQRDMQHPRERIKLSHWREARMRWMRQNREFKSDIANPVILEELQLGNGVIGKGPERGGCVRNALSGSKQLSILLSSFQTLMLFEEYGLGNKRFIEAFLQKRCFYSHGSTGEDVAGFNFVLSRSFSILRPGLKQSTYLSATAIAQEHGVQVQINKPDCKCSLTVPVQTLRAYFRPDDSIWMNPWLLALEKFLAEMAVFPYGTGFKITRLDTTWKLELSRRKQFTALQQEKAQREEKVARDRALELSNARLVNRMRDHALIMKSAREALEKERILTARGEWKEMLQADAESTSTRAYLVATPASLERVKDAFDLFDTDNSGTVTSSEFQQLCFEIGEVYSEKQVSAIVAQIDSDQNGEIDLEEFTVWWFSSAHDTTSTGVQLASLKAKLTVYRQMRKMKENAKVVRSTMVGKPLRASL